MKKIVVILLLMLPGFEVIAQSGGYSGSFTRMGFGPRGMAMGNTLATFSQEGVYAHYNPALAAYVNGNQIDISTALMSFDRSLHAISATFPLPPLAGLNIGILNANVYDIDGRTASGYHTDKLSTHEFQLFAAFGLNLGEKVRMGASIKFHLANYYEEVSNATGAGFDLGLIYEPLPNWNIGFTVQDLIAEYSWNTTDLYGTQGGRNRNNAFPVRFKLSSSYLVEPWNLLFSSDFEIQYQKAEYEQTEFFSSSLPPQNRRIIDQVITSGSLMRLGAAWKAHERFTLRGGWEIMDVDYLEETHKISAGFSIHLPYDAYRPSIDYAFVREPLGIAGMHVLAIRFML